MLELYQHEACEDSGLVRTRLSDLGLSYVIHNPREPGSMGGDVLNEQTYEAMQTLGGEDRFPFLIDTLRGEAIYGEDEIMAYLSDNYG